MKVILDNPKQTDVYELRKLWSEVFHDEDWYLDLFFENIFDIKNTLAGKMEDKVSAMLYMVPYKLKYEESVYDIMYLYALATNKAFRKKGIMTGLIKKSEEIAENFGYIGSFLIPAEAGLVSYYENLGFDKVIESKMNIETKDCKNHIILDKKQEFVNNQILSHETFLKKEENNSAEDSYSYIGNDTRKKGLFRFNKSFRRVKDISSIVNEKYIDINIDGVLL